MPRNYDLLAELIEVIGEDATFTLVENLAGTRLYVPKTNRPFLILVELLGKEAAAAMSARFGPDYIKVPMARAFRARRHRAAGMSNAKIAVRLGMTEAGFDRLVQREGLSNRATAGSKCAYL